MVLSRETGWLYEGNMGGADKTRKAPNLNTRFSLVTFLWGAQGSSLMALNPIARFP